VSDVYEAQGHWWLPGREDKKVPGTLKFDPDIGGTLSLIGALSVWTDYAEPVIGEDGSVMMSMTLDVQQRSGDYPRVYGEADGHPFTLDDCFQTHVSGSMFGPASKQTVRVDRVYRDVSFSDGEGAGANALNLSLAYLNDWAMETYIDEAHTFDKEARRPMKFDLSVKLKPNREVGIGDGIRLSLLHRAGCGGRRSTRRHLWQGYILRLDADNVTPIDDLIDTASDFQDLVSIATGRNAAFHSLFGFHPDLTKEVPSEEHKAYSVPFEIMSQWNIRDTASKPDQIEFQDLFFSLDDLGGMDGVAKWMKAAREHRSTLGRTMSTLQARACSSRIDSSTTRQRSKGSIDRRQARTSRICPFDCDAVQSWRGSLSRR
jgi:hypothetical protein